MEKRIIIAGSGGQGVLFLGKLLAYAAMIEGREVTWFPSYGAEMRGGTANCTVIMSDRMIGCPVVTNPDVLVVMNDASFQRFADRLAPGGMLLYDPVHVHPAAIRSDIRAVTIPAGDISSSLHCPQSANIALAGGLLAATQLLNLQSALLALEEITPARRRDQLPVNRDALLQGYGMLAAIPSSIRDNGGKGTSLSS